MTDALTSQVCSELLPKRNKREARLEYENTQKLSVWKMFALRVRRNPFMKMTKQDEQDNTCPVCHEYVNANMGTLHHMDYEHLCISDVCAKFSSPTEKRPTRMISAPDCERCLKTNPAEFAECAKRLVLVHKRCHMKIHGLERAPKNL